MLPNLEETEETHVRPLSEYVATAPLTTDRLLALTKAITEALAQNHALGTWRGDLAPARILWDGADSITLLDAPMPAEPPLNFERSTGREALDAVGYLAPEQCDDTLGEPGPRSDVFALGVIVFELASGEHPFAGRRGDEIVSNILSFDPPTPGQIHPALPLEWDAVCACCMHKPIEQRFASALDVLPFLAKLASSGGTRRRQQRLAWDRIVLAMVVLISLMALAVWLLG
jgi:serine/threonine-protein kinase